MTEEKNVKSIFVNSIVTIPPDILPSHRGAAPLHTRRWSIAARAPLHVVADLDRDFMSIVPRNPNHQRCLLRGNSMEETREKKETRKSRRRRSTNECATTTQLYGKVSRRLSASPSPFAHTLTSQQNGVCRRRHYHHSPFDATSVHEISGRVIAVRQPIAAK